MAVFNCPECGALSHADHEAKYYWCDCGQPLTAVNAVPGMADGVADQTPRTPAPAPVSEEPAPLPEASEEAAEEAEKFSEDRVHSQTELA